MRIIDLWLVVLFIVSHFHTRQENTNQVTMLKKETMKILYTSHSVTLLKLRFSVISMCFLMYANCRIASIIKIHQVEVITCFPSKNKG